MVLASPISSERLMWAIVQRQRGRSWELVAKTLKVSEHNLRMKIDPEYMGLHKDREARRIAREEKACYEPMPKAPLLSGDPLLDRLRSGLK